jgi:hypothetical protein
MNPSLKLNNQRLAIILAIFPALFLGYLVLKFWVNVPVWDQWEITDSVFSKIADQRFSIIDLFAQHNESRIFFPRLITLGVAYLTDWDTRYEMIIIFALACINSVNFYWLIRHTVSSSKDVAKSLFILALINLLIFSPTQYENWFWGFQVALSTPTVCLTTGLLVFASQLNISRKVVWGMIIAAISTFSFANGLLCWVLLPISVLLSPDWQSLKKKPTLIVLWMLGFITNFGLYFHNYQKPKAHPSLSEGVQYPIKAFQYFCAFLGNHLSGGNQVIAITIGLIQLIVLGYILLFIGRSWSDSLLRQRSAPWITISLYVLVSALITTVGRVGLGLDQALASRYASFSVYLTAALIILCVIVADSSDQRSASERRVQHSATILTVLATTCVVLHLIASLQSFTGIQKDYRVRLYAKTCLNYIAFVQDSCIAGSPFPLDLRERLELMNQAGVLTRTLAQAPFINSAGSTSTTGEVGWFEQLKQDASGKWLASGWATLPNRKKSAEIVLLTYQDKKGKARIFAIGSVLQDRPDVAKFKRSEAFLTSGWAVTFSRDKLPRRREAELRAWAYDVQLGKTFPLGGAQVLKPDSSKSNLPSLESPSPKSS